MELALFLAAIFCLLFIPSIPSIMEWLEGSDKMPLKVVQEYDSDIRYFARNYKTFLDGSFGDAMAVGEQLPKSKIGKLLDNTNFMLVRKGHRPLFSEKEMGRLKTSKMIVAESALSLPGNMVFEKEMFSQQTIHSGENSRFRAVHAEGDIMLNNSNIVLRWIHSGGILTVNPGCHLFGRASADDKIEMAEGCYFERINAPRILFGTRPTVTESHPPLQDLQVLEDLPHVKDQFERRWFVQGDCHIPENSFFDGDIVATKSVIVGANSHITGSIKSNKDLVLDPRVQIDGSIFATNIITIGEGCKITGPVVAEDSIFIDSNCSFGSLEIPTTLSAPEIEIASGVIVYGTVWADESGLTQSAA